MESLQQQILLSRGSFFRFKWNRPLTSKENFALPKLVFCFCQKLSGLMMSATQISTGKNSCSVFSRGLISSHLDPRMSMMTVKPLLHTSSLQSRQVKSMFVRASDVTKDFSHSVFNRWTEVQTYEWIMLCHVRQEESQFIWGFKSTCYQLESPAGNLMLLTFHFNSCRQSQG